MKLKRLYHKDIYPYRAFKMRLFFIILLCALPYYAQIYISGSVIFKINKDAAIVINRSGKDKNIKLLLSNKQLFLYNNYCFHLENIPANKTKKTNSHLSLCKKQYHLPFRKSIPKGFWTSSSGNNFMLGYVDSPYFSILNNSTTKYAITTRHLSHNSFRVVSRRGMPAGIALSFMYRIMQKLYLRPPPNATEHDFGAPINEQQTTNLS